ncbi:MAG TPA: DUF4260 domain-containing protein [Candidatus Acidoferrales bacterium]
MNSSQQPIEGVVTGSIRLWLQAEALAVLALSLLLYARLGQHWWIFAAVFLVPDLSMLGYLFSPKIGAACYNIVHTYVTPLALGAFAALTHRENLYPYVCIWTAHIALDRALAFGLKYPDAFAHTHLGLHGKFSK